MSWVRYIQGKHQKTLEVAGCRYTFKHMEWVKIDNPVVKRRIFDHPTVFESADFDIGMIGGVPNVQCHGKLIYTEDPNAIDMLQNSKYFALKVKNNNQYIFRVSISDSRFQLISLLAQDKGSVGIYRMKGGWGDVVMAFAAAKALKKQNPHLDITYSCPSNFRELVDGDPDVPWQDLNLFCKAGYDVYVNLTSPCIQYEISKQPNVDRNRTEIFCRECAINYKQSYKPHQVIKKEKLTSAEAFFKSQNPLYKVVPKIGFIPVSCAPIRNWWGFEKVSRTCAEKYNSMNLIFNSDVNYKWNGHRDDIKILGYSMGNVVALLSLCDLVIGVDTGPMHSAASLGIPTIWVFTHIDGKIRTEGYSAAHVVQNKDCPRSPCWYDKPCEDGKIALCGKQVKPQIVMGTVKKIIKDVLQKS